jgi:hypothetical protein
VGQALISGHAPQAALGDPGVARAVVGAGLALTALAVLSVAAGTLLRHPACSSPSCTPSPGRCWTAGTHDSGQGASPHHDSASGSSTGGLQIGMGRIRQLTVFEAVAIERDRRNAGIQTP